MDFLNIFKHLLPRGKAWHITIDKNLRRLFVGLSSLGDDSKEFVDDVWQDIFPQTTREIAAWEQQFGLRNTDLTTQERRDRLDATWKAQGGQSPRYIQDTLQNNGFDVYVHEWWIPGTYPECGEVWVECGEVEAECGNFNPNAVYFPVGFKQCLTARNPLDYLRREYTGTPESGKGYPLVNKIYFSQPDEITLCGEEGAECGEEDAECGNYFKFYDAFKNYVISLDPAEWHYFLYIGGETFGELAEVPEERQDEFEALCLKICPTQQWLGMLINYV